MNSLIISFLVIFVFIIVTQLNDYAISSLLEERNSVINQDWNHIKEKRYIQRRPHQRKDGLGRRLSANNCGKYSLPTERIIGGHNSSKGEHPWIVAILNDGAPWCAGSIINKRWILTAAHCLKRYNLSLFTITAGSNIFLFGRLIKFKKVVLHSKYNLKGYVENDIALMMTTKPIKFSKLIRPVCLPDNSYEKPRASKVVVAGWGKTDSARYSPYLKDVTLDVVNDTKCADKHRVIERKVFPSQLCTWTSKKDSCNGDSGGPVVELIKGKATLVGIISSGSFACANGFPGLNTEVSHFLKWISYVMKKNKT